MNCRVLVTGGAGFIGGHVARAYLAAGYDVTVLDDLSTGRSANVPAGAQFVRADVRSAEARALLATGGFGVVNHHAAQIDVRASVADPLADGSVNVIGLLNVLEGARAGGVRRVILASSGGAIYGDGAALPTAEHAPKLPASPYGVAKLASEYYLATFALLHRLETVVLRYSNVYGPGQRADGEGGVVAVFAKRALQAAPLTIFGDGTQTRDMVYVEDVADANIAATRCAALTPASVDSCAYNIGTGVQTTVQRMAQLIVSSCGSGAPIEHAAPRAGEIRYSALSNDKAAEGLGWRPARSLETGIRATLRWVAATNGNGAGVAKATGSRAVSRAAP